MLHIENLHAYYGSGHVLGGVCLDLGAGEILALLGRNGAGRSTLAKAIMGLVDWRGTITYQGQSLAGKKPFEIARLGLGYVPESRDVFPQLTVAQNLLLGQKPLGKKQSGKKAADGGRWCLSDMYDLFPQLQARAHTPAGLLSGGEQQMLTLCRTLMGEPGLIVIDEPTEGLAPQIVAQVAEFLQILRQRGVGVLLIEQKLTMALDICDRVALMGHGRVVFEGSAAALQAEENLRRQWLQV